MKMYQYLDMAWEDARSPEYADLQGHFEVNILSGYFKVYELFTKTWEKKIFNQEGYNLVDNKVTGYFKVTGTTKALRLIYNQNQEPAYWGLVEDELRMIEPGLFVGKIWFRVWGKLRFMGYFSLVQMIQGTQKVQEDLKDKLWAAVY